KDGIADKIDACPNDAEDKDNFEDDDGCPDPDNDKDGVLDGDDKCPNEPGVPPDGCPKKYNLVVVTENKIELKQTVYFDTRKATIKPVSFPLLTEVAQALADNPTLKVDVEGHTDSQGNDRFNLRLSQKRAESVKKFLVGRGVAPTRLAPKGYGENVPIADNRTADGRAQNRRVEFVITSR
ncbi:MAG TPA: OmpA family protein, partial [Kofleriaceae bacterium]|nr:OmpA family protein [Kofleriaceae bacterium]